MAKRGPFWHPDLSAMGYKESLSPLILRVYATLTAINPTKIYKFEQDTDFTAINFTCNEGEPALLFTMLDLFQWTHIFEVANTNLWKALDQLLEFHEVLHQILASDENDLIQAKKNTIVVEVTIRHANNQAEDCRSSPLLTIPESGTFQHPFMVNLDIDKTHKAALEDFQESIVVIQIEKEKKLLVASG